MSPSPQRATLVFGSAHTASVLESVELENYLLRITMPGGSSSKEQQFGENIKIHKDKESKERLSHSPFLSDGGPFDSHLRIHSHPPDVHTLQTSDGRPFDSHLRIQGRC